MGVTPLSIIGETDVVLSSNSHRLILEALVVNEVDVEVLAGIPFMTQNGISIHPTRNYHWWFRCCILWYIHT